MERYDIEGVECVEDFCGFVLLYPVGVLTRESRRQLELEAGEKRG